MFDASVIKGTGQWWKAVASFWALIVGGCGMFWGLSQLTADAPAYVIVLVFGGMGLAAFAFAFACLSIRCATCGARWVWMGVSGKGPGGWLAWLLSRSECPACKSGARTRTT